MALVVQHEVEDLTQHPFQIIQASYTEHLSCGLILAPCTDMLPKHLDQLKAFIIKYQEGHSSHYFFDKKSMIFWMILDNQKLAGTHYISLLLKEFLQNHGLLKGNIGVASFPESGEPEQAALMEWLQTAVHEEGDDQDIRLYLDQSVKDIPSVLVVDADEISREFIKLRLELKGYEVHEAKDGFEALKKYSQSSPNLVITELSLPVLDGYQLISSIRESQGKEGKVMVLTDKNLPHSVHRAFELGASDYVTKPFSITELEWRIKKLVNY